MTMKMLVPTCRAMKPVAGLLAFTVCGMSTLLANDHGFANQPLGGPNDPRIEIIASMGSGGAGEVVVPGDDAFDPCGAYVYDDTTDAMTVVESPKTLPQTIGGAGNAWIALRFPFAIAKPKVAKTIFKNDPNLAPVSYLTPNVTITDETGAHVPVLAFVGGKDVTGLKQSHDPSFPLHLNENAENLLASKRTLLLVANEPGGTLATISNFSASGANPLFSPLREIRIRVEKIGGVSIHGFWVLKIGDGAGMPVTPPLELFVTAIEATKPEKPEHFVDFGLVVKPKTKFVVHFSEPVDPWSVGVTKSLAKQFDIPFEKNIAVTLHPCHSTSVFPSGAPLFPNLQVLVEPKVGPAFPAPFNVRPVNPNNLAEYLVDPLVPLPKGTITVNVFPFSVNTSSYEGNLVTSAPTTHHGVVFNDLSGNGSRLFSIDG